MKIYALREDYTGPGLFSILARWKLIILLTGRQKDWGDIIEENVGTYEVYQGLY